MNTPKSSEALYSSAHNLCSIRWAACSVPAFTNAAPSGAGASIVNPNTFAPSACDHTLSASNAPHKRNFIVKSTFRTRRQHTSIDAGANWQGFFTLVRRGLRGMG